MPNLSPHTVPPNIEGNPEARFDVVLLRGGDVLSATLRKSSGNPAYDAAVERAILAAQPLESGCRQNAVGRVKTIVTVFIEGIREATDSIG